MQPFEFHARTRVVFGAGEVARVGTLAAELGRRALLVADPGIVATGLASRVRGLLESAGVAVVAVRRLRREPRLGDGRARTRRRGAARRRRHRRRRRRQLARLRQGHQLRADQRRHGRRLQGIRQGQPADAADARRADDGGNGQRGAVVRRAVGRRDAHQDGLRRAGRRVPGRAARPRAHRDGASRRSPRPPASTPCRTPSRRG